MIAQYIPYAVSAALIAATLIDLRTGRIPNWVAYVFFALFAVVIAVSPDKSDFIWQGIFAMSVLCIGMALYGVFGMGAGAVKLLAGAALFLPMGRAGAIAGLLVLTLFTLGFFVFVLRRVFGSEKSNWVVLKKPVMPLSLPVTVTCMLALFWLQA